MEKQDPRLKSISDKVKEASNRDVGVGVMDVLKQAIYSEGLGLERFRDNPKDVSIETIVEPVLEQTAGLAANTALSFGFALSDLSAGANLLTELLSELNEVKAPGQPQCKLPGKIVSEESHPTKQGPADPEVGTICVRRSPLLKAISDTVDSTSKIGGSDKDAFDPVELLQNIFNVISELNKPADLAECVNPYFDQFFNLIPIQLIVTKYLRDLAKEALAALSDQEIEKLLVEVDPCGTELKTIFKNSLDFPEIPNFKLPAIPTIPNLNLYTIFRKIIIELICFAVCYAMTHLIIWASKLINKWLNEFLNSSGMTAGEFSEFQTGLLGKIKLNDEITDDILDQAIVQNKVSNYKKLLKEIIGPPPSIISDTVFDKDGLWRQPTEEEQKLAISKIKENIRSYFQAIYDYRSEVYQKQIYNPMEKKYVLTNAERELGTKELVFLMMGEFNCFTIEDLKNVGSKSEFSLLDLGTEQKIKRFFTFIGGDIDPIQVITKLKSPDCPPNPCEEDVVEKMKGRVSELCDSLNLQKSGLPPLPMNKLLKTIGLDNLFSSGIKEQFNLLKTEKLFSLEYPSIESYDSQKSLSPFMPPEVGDINDYALAKKIDSDDFFEKYLSRGGPTLKWKYDDVDFATNLSGASLEDICGDDETFEETIIHIHNDVFKMDLKKTVDSMKDATKDYKESIQNKIKSEFEKRTLEGTKSACCKYPSNFNKLIFSLTGDFTVKKENLVDYDDATDVDSLGWNYQDFSISDIEAIKFIYDNVEGAGYEIDKGDYEEFLTKHSLSKEIRCYLCRRRTQFTDKDDNSHSFFSWLEFDNEEIESLFFNKIMNCKEFGFAKSTGGDAPGAAKDKPNSPIGKLLNNKCKV